MVPPRTADPPAASDGGRRPPARTDHLARRHREARRIAHHRRARAPEDAAAGIPADWRAGRGRRAGGGRRCQPRGRRRAGGGATACAPSRGAPSSSRSPRCWSRRRCPSSDGRRRARSPTAAKARRWKPARPSAACRRRRRLCSWRSTTPVPRPASRSCRWRPTAVEAPRWSCRSARRPTWTAWPSRCGSTRRSRTVGWTPRPGPWRACSASAPPPARRSNEDQLASLLAPYAPVEVTFDTPVLETASNGATREVFECRRAPAHRPPGRAGAARQGGRRE